MPDPRLASKLTLSREGGTSRCCAAAAAVLATTFDTQDSAVLPLVSVRLLCVGAKSQHTCTTAGGFGSCGHLSTGKQRTKPQTNSPFLTRFSRCSAEVGSMRTLASTVGVAACKRCWAASCRPSQLQCCVCCCCCCTATGACLSTCLLQVTWLQSSSSTSTAQKKSCFITCCFVTKSSHSTLL